MGKSKIIKKSSSITVYTALSGEAVLKNFKNFNEQIIFPFGKEQKIKISTINEHVIFELFNKTKNNTKLLKLSKASFEYREIPEYWLNELAESFDLEKKYGTNQSYYSLISGISSNKEICNIAVEKDFYGNYYFLLYTTGKTRESQSMAEDYFPDNIIYVLGIWEVELSKDFEKKLGLV